MGPFSSIEMKIGATNYFLTSSSSNIGAFYNFNHLYHRSETIAKLVTATRRRQSNSGWGYKGAVGASLARLNAIVEPRANDLLSVILWAAKLRFSETALRGNASRFVCPFFLVVLSDAVTTSQERRFGPFIYRDLFRGELFGVRFAAGISADRLKNTRTGFIRTSEKNSGKFTFVDRLFRWLHTNISRHNNLDIGLQKKYFQ